VGNIPRSSTAPDIMHVSSSLFAFDSDNAHSRKLEYTMLQTFLHIVLTFSLYQCRIFCGTSCVLNF
jgi:hypothetical protein